MDDHDVVNLRYYHRKHWAITCSCGEICTSYAGPVEAFTAWLDHVIAEYHIYERSTDGACDPSCDK